MSRYFAFAVLVFALPFFSGCGGCGGGQPAQRVSGGGATFVNPIMQKWSGEYKTAKNVEIDYVSKGSGYGVEQMTAKTKDFGCSDAPLTKEQLATAKEKGGDVVHIPLTMGAVAVVYNVPEISGKELKLTGDVLADIYRRDPSVQKWNAKRIADLNPGLSLPDKDIVVVARAEKSGTSNIFSEYLSKTSGGKIKASTKPDWVQGVVGQEGNDGVAGFVKGNAGTIGYVELLFARKNELPTAKLKNKAGEWVGAEADGVTAAAAEAIKSKPDKEPYSLHDLTYSLTDTAGAKSYPISGISYAILFAKLPKDTGPTIVDFLKWATTDGQKFAKDMDYAPLPEELSKKIQEKLGQVTFE
ncbi:Phosphate-binding protein PstS precursor [Gemmata sp. SH-PL17]|uniref:phosphate ABC transporter substrate-binding protein PstS n=1 Tax=Gemmata sp. SH-PL17 TaxID=1630693 RepID=UPI00078EDE13|nr:phosphate ABC transporter substrate-binding protein PstS [Gemmata sp. SH-PL17]AMV26872.1 Phosphate-binding protein PstS precursor [Gemmata sp. SH-PL17]